MLSRIEMEERLVRGFSKALGVEVGAEKVRELVVRGKGDFGGLQLLAWDANSIHGFVFDTTNATAVQGASEILKGIDRRLKSGEPLGLDGGQVLYAGGGSGLAVVSPGQAGSALGGLHELYARETAVATCTAVAVRPLEDGGGFGQWVVEAGRGLARRRLLEGPFGEPDVPFFAERCGVCGKRAAAGLVRRMEGFRVECAPCSLKIDRGRDQRRDRQEPSSYEEISDDQGFYAVIYLDGNGMGRLISSLETPLEYALFSQDVEGALKAAFRRVTEGYGLRGEPVSEGDGGGEGWGRGGERGPHGRRLGYRLPISGGDDLVMILPGCMAVPLARDLLGELERSFEALFGKSGCLGDAQIRGMGAAAGVALAHTGFPVRYLLVEAESLLKRAKRRVYDHGARSAIDFSVITDGSPRAEWEEAERWQRREGELLLSGRPYSLEEFERFSERFRAIRKVRGEVGRGQFYELRRLARESRALLRAQILYQVGRRGEWQELVKSLPALEGDGPVRLDRGSFLRSAEAVFRRVVPEIHGREVFDIGDMLDLSGHWWGGDAPWAGGAGRDGGLGDGGGPSEDRRAS